MMITIAIPFYNAEKYLAVAIDSVIGQTFTNWKLILIDDGSTDNCLSIAAEYEKKDARIKVFSDGLNQNLGYRLNQIPTLVNTKYLARMDADDIMHPEKIKKQLSVLINNPEIDVLGTNAYSIDENNLIQGVRLQYSDKELLSNVKGFIHPTVVAKTEWFINNPYDVKAERIEDAELWFRTSDNYNFQILTEPLFFYREFGNNYYKKYFKGFQAMLYVLKKHSYNFKIFKFAVRYYLSGLIYLLYNIFGMENVLVRKRNAVVLDNITIANILQ